MLWRYGDGLLRFLRKDPNWPYPDRSLNRINDRHRREMTDHIVAELDDHTALVEKCIPDYPPFGKRMLLDNGWYETLSLPHVELVTSGVDRSVDDRSSPTASTTPPTSSCSQLDSTSPRWRRRST